MERSEIFIKLACDYLQLPVDAVCSKSRLHPLCEARQIISYLLIENTKLSLAQIAKRLNYVSHASPWRDFRQVTNFLEIDKIFIMRITPLIKHAREIAENFDRKETLIRSGALPDPGDICWFWFSHTSDMPRIGTLMFINGKPGKCTFTAREFFGNFDRCIYAGDQILPEIFRLRIKTEKESVNTKASEPVPA